MSMLHDLALLACNRWDAVDRAYTEHRPTQLVLSSIDRAKEASSQLRAFVQHELSTLGSHSRDVEAQPPTAQPTQGDPEQAPSVDTVERRVAL